MRSTEERIFRRIAGNGSGWAFSQSDFADIAKRDVIDQSLSRLEKKGKIRRVFRGLYDYPKYSELIGDYLRPDIDQVAHALARKFGWRIFPGGSAALNRMGVSSQVPGRMIYFSDGPHRTYSVSNVELTFKSQPLKEAAFKLPESILIVQGLKSLGSKGITDQEIEQIREWLNPSLRQGVLKDTRTVSGWIYEAIHKICRIDSNG